MEMKLEKVTDRIYANTEGKTGGNVAVVLLKNKAVAIDAQYVGSAKLFREAIEKLTPKKITHLLLTHVHGDHVFGNQVFEDCEIVAQRLLKEKMEKQLQNEWAPGNFEKMVEGMKSRMPDRAWLYEGMRIVLPNAVFQKFFALSDGETILEMIHTGGHTDCSSIVYVPKDKVLIAGDILFAKTFPYAGDPTADPDKWIEAFEMILKMDVDTIVPGHGPVCNKAEIEKQLSYFKAVRDEVKKLIAAGATVDDVVKHTGYPAFYEATGGRLESTLRQWYRFWAGKP